MFKSAAVLKNSDGKIIGGVETLTDLSEALAKEAIISDLRQVLNAKDGYQSMTGKSTAMQHVYELITSVAKSDIPVIIYGENGTGKELAANAIYNISDRKKGHFIKVNCAALNESLLESELFGHVKGAYTGALKTRIGRFEAAHKGAIFLDEIGDIPVIEHAFVLCREGEITPDHLPSNLFKKQIKQPHGLKYQDQPGSDEEKKQLMAAISSTMGNKSKAAKILGISRVALYNRLKKYNIYVDKTVRE